MKKVPAAASFDLNLAPMVDVMMCLLIFFMLATRMVEQENSRIDLPVARTAQDLERSQLDHRFVINITNPKGAPGPTYLIREESHTRDEVFELIDAEARRHPGVNCVIRADRGLPYAQIETILEQCVRAGVTNITFGALRSEGVGS